MTEGIRCYGDPLGLYRLPMDSQLAHLGYLRHLAREEEYARGQVDSIDDWEATLPEHIPGVSGG